MKHLVSVCLITLLATPAFASKSRINSLQGRLGLIDNQTIFDQPAYVNQLAPNVNFEFGSTSVTGNPKAEGGFIADQGGARVGAYLGHVSPYQTLLRANGTFQGQDNPVDLFYGGGNWGANLSVSNSEDKTTSAKQTTIIGRGGFITGAHEVSVSADLYATAEKLNAGNTDKFKSELPVIEANYLNRQEDMLWAVTAAYGTAEQTIATVKQDITYTGVSASLNRFLTENVYWGAGLNYSELKIQNLKRKVTTLPLSLGLEREMLTWMVVRGSVQQNFLIGSTKDEISGTAETKNLNDTRVAAGVGFKHNNFVIDGTLAASTTGRFNGNDFLTQGSLTYTF